MYFSKEPRGRWTLANILPFVFTIWVISAVWAIYVCFHLRPLMVINWTRFKVEAGMSQTLTALLVVCFVRAVATDPGTVPDTPEWRDVAEGSETLMAQRRLHGKLVEVKYTGGRRVCKWCSHYKPDRCHHCRICNRCILRMDHHCPWIVNCVGFKNHKYFLLLVIYALLTSSFVVSTQLESVGRSLVVYTPAPHRMLLVFGTTLATIMCILLTGFCALHAWFAITSTTTIEFYEKRARNGQMPCYRQGLYKDLQAVLGPNVLLWFLPLSTPEGDGLLFPTGGRGPEAGSTAAASGKPDAAVTEALFSDAAPNSKELAPEVTGSLNAAATA